MKKKFLLFVLITLVASIWTQQSLFAQMKPYRVVFDLTSADTADHHSLVRWITGITKGNPGAQLEVVLYGKSLPLVTKGKSSFSNEVQTLAQNKNITFRVCEIAMKRHRLTKSDFLPGVGTVPDGIAEIVQKQSQGWGYIKAAR